MRNKKENLSFLSDLAKMATGAISSLPDIREQIKETVQGAVDQIIDKMDLVTRAEFERVEAMAVKARQKQDELEKRLDALAPKAKPKAAPKAKKTAAPNKAPANKKRK